MDTQELAQEVPWKALYDLASHYEMWGINQWWVRLPYINSDTLPEEDYRRLVELGYAEEHYIDSETIEEMKALQEDEPLLVLILGLAMGLAGQKDEWCSFRISDAGIRLFNEHPTDTLMSTLTKSPMPHLDIPTNREYPDFGEIRHAPA